MVLLNLLVKPFWIFAIDRNVQNVVGYESYGLYAALLNLCIVFNIMLDLGITNYNNKTIAENPSLINTYLPNMLVAKSILSFVYLGVILILALVFSYQGLSLHLLFCIAGIQLLNSFLLYLRSNISAQHDFKIDSVLSILDKVLMIIFCGVLLLNGELRQQFTIAWFVYAQLLAYAVSIVLALLIIFYRYTRLASLKLDKPLIKELLLKSLPYALLILLMGIYMRLDSVLLERLLSEQGAYQNGLYVSAYRILDALNMFGFLFAGILLPMFSRMLAFKNNIQELVQTTSNILIPISLVIAAHGFFYNSEIMNGLYLHNTEVASNIYRFVILCFPAYCIMYIYSTLLTANGNIFLLIKIAMAASILSVGLNVILIPLYMAQSVAWVSVAVHWFAAICYILFCIKNTEVEIKIYWAFQFVFIFLAFLCMNYLFKFAQIGLILSIALNVAIFLPIVFAIRLWNWKHMAKYFQQIVVKE